MQHLFPDTYLATVSRLSLSVRTAPLRAAAGVYPSRAAGASLQFRDYQPYMSGDDLRRVDWAVYGRTRHLFVRRFDRPTQVPVFVLVDASSSMLLEETPGGPTRYATAARVAAAMASAAVGSQNPVYLRIAGSDSMAMSQAMTGRRGLMRALAELAVDREGGRTGVVDALTALRPLLASRGPGVLAIISDFFDDLGVGKIIDTLRLLSARLVLLQVAQPWDAEPALTGDVELADCETDARRAVSIDSAALARYRAAYRAYFDELRAFAAVRGATYATFDASTDTLGQLESAFPDGVMKVN